MAYEYAQVYAISSDLHTLPLVVAEGNTVEALCEMLGQWHEAGMLSEADKRMVQTAYETMQAPSDGLLGTAVSGVFTLPGLNGMRIHLQGVG